MNTDNIMTNLNGIKNGDATSIAIILLPVGNLDISGSASWLYIISENGNKIIKNTKTHNNDLEILDLSSAK